MGMVKVKVCTGSRAMRLVSVHTCTACLPSALSCTASRHTLLQACAESPIPADHGSASFGPCSHRDASTPGVGVFVSGIAPPRRVDRVVDREVNHTGVCSGVCSEELGVCIRLDLGVVDVLGVAVLHPEVPPQRAPVGTVVPHELGGDLQLHPQHRPAPPPPQPSLKPPGRQAASVPPPLVM